MTDGDTSAAFVALLREVRACRACEPELPCGARRVLRERVRSLPRDERRVA